MSYWEALLLGVIQGLTEFLPVSSSGHLVLGKALLGIEINDITFEVFVHFGTLLAVMTVFRNDILLLLKGFVALVTFKGKSSNEEEKQGIKMLWLLFLGTLPAAVLGLLFKDYFEAAFQSPRFVCAALLVTGLLLLSTRFIKNKGAELNVPNTLIIGFAQVGAIFPGISRSGTTISTALLLGIEREAAARFSFLLAVPLILGASGKQAVDMLSDLPSTHEMIGIALGTLAAYVSGLFAIKWLVSAIKQGMFDRFAYYCFVVGMIGIIVLF